jgi:hypothetical protein
LFAELHRTVGGIFNARCHLSTTPTCYFEWNVTYPFGNVREITVRMHSHLVTFTREMQAIGTWFWHTLRTRAGTVPWPQTTRQYTRSPSVSCLSQCAQSGRRTSFRRRSGSSNHT